MVEANANNQGHNFFQKLLSANFQLFLSTKVFQTLHFDKFL